MVSFSSRRQLRRFSKDDEGQALVLTALGLVLLMLMAGLGVDVGFLRYEKQQMQKAADAAALAGAATLAYDPAHYVAAGIHDATANGFTNGQNGIVVTVISPPQTPGDPFYLQANYVEAIVSQPQPTFFMRITGSSSVPVRSRAIASAVGNASECMIVMAPSGSGALTVKGTANVSAACTIIVNSNDSAAITKTGSGAISANYIGVVGGMNEVGSGSVRPAPITNIGPVADPLINVQEPTPSTCTPQNGHITGSAPHVLNEGTFCGGISITGSGSVTFTPGTYILEGGGLSVGGSGIITGNGVTFYNTGNSTYPYQPITFVGSTSSTLTAPTSGPLTGMLFFQDRSITDCCGPTSVNTIDGSSGANITGALYFPTTPLRYTGSASSSAYSIVVAWTLEYVGSTSLNDDYSSLPNGASPIHSSILVE